MTPAHTSNPSTPPSVEGVVCVALCPAAGGSTRNGSVAAAPVSLPVELREVLAQRRAAVHAEAEPLLALAALVKHERRLAAAPKSGAKGEPLLLLLVEPSRLGRVEGLIAAVSKYAPHAAVWTFDSTAARKLARYVAPVPGASGGAGISGGAVASGGNGVRAANGNGRPALQVVPSGGGGMASGGSGGFVSWVGLPRPVARPRLKLADGPAAPAEAASKIPAASGAAAADQAPEAKPARSALTEQELAMLLGDGPRNNGSGGTQR